MKKKKIAIILVIVFLLIFSLLSAWIFLQLKQSSSSEETLADGQQLIYGQIETIYGNEMTISFASATTINRSSKNTGRQNGKSTTDESVFMPSGEMEEKFNPQEKNESSGSANATQKAEEESEEAQTMISYRLTGDKQTMTIPVGTTVTTLLGTQTTFSRLASGDMLKLLVEKDGDGNEVIVGIWIVQ